MTDEELDALDEVYDTMMEVQRNPTGAWQAIQDQAVAITTLRAQLAEARVELVRRVDMHECAMKERDDTTLYADELKARADRAEQRVATLEAALAAPEVMHEDAPAAIVGEIGNQIHNLGCELQNDEDVSLRLSDLACRCWDAAKLFPTDRTALDRVIAETREKALREAAEILDDEGWLGMSKHRILALIEKEKAE